MMQCHCLNAGPTLDPKLAMGEIVYRYPPKADMFRQRLTRTSPQAVFFPRPSLPHIRPGTDSLRKGMVLAHPRLAPVLRASWRFEADVRLLFAAGKIQSHSFQPVFHCRCLFSPPPLPPQSPSIVRGTPSPVEGKIVKAEVFVPSPANQRICNTETTDIHASWFVISNADLFTGNASAQQKKHILQV